MNKYIILGITFLIALSACKPKDDTTKILAVSIEPQRYFLTELVQDKYRIHNVIPENANAESFDPAPAAMLALGKSEMYFKVGHLGFENAWLANLQKNNPDLKIVDCSKSIELEDCDGHSHGGADPHIWSSPSTALIMAHNMYDALVKHDPKNEAFYKANLEKLIGKFHQTDSIIKLYLAKAPSQSFIIYHPALSYFAHEYGLTQHSIEREGKNPSPSQLKELIDRARKKNVQVVFMQQEFDQKNAETIAKEIGAKVVPINLLTYSWHEEMIKIAKALASTNE